MDVRDAVVMARGLVAEHGLVGWTVVLDRAKTRAGVCRAHTKEIGLSAPLTALHDEAEVRDTVLHEIAHALVGPRHGHDAVWRATARRIGCSAQRTSSGPRTQGPWTGTCPAGHEMSRHQRPTRVMACARCGRGFDPANVVSWTFRGRPVTAEELPASYREDWAHLQSGLTGGVLRQRLPLGTRVVVGGGGPHAGTRGEIVKLGRTRYHVRTRAGVLTVPFPLVEAVAGR